MSEKSGKEEIFRRYMDGELSAEEERRALHIIADDEEMREMLRFERSLYQTIERVPAEPESFAVPAGFTDSVMDKIGTANTPEVSAYAFQERLKKIVTPLVLPRNFQLRPIYAMAAALLMGALISLPFIQDQNLANPEGSDLSDRSVQVVSEKEQEVWIRFVFFDEEAGTVAVAGDFSDWEPISLENESVDGRQVWTGLVPVLRGEQRYMFIRDGEEWVTDPLAETIRDDGFGNKNAVLYL